LVRNTLESYRYQIEQQGFAFEESIDSKSAGSAGGPRSDRACLSSTWFNNALKYSSEEKFLGVKLYRENGVVKLEVADHGIGIARRDPVENFLRSFIAHGDPLVHNTKGKRPFLFVPCPPYYPGAWRGPSRWKALPEKAVSLFYRCHWLDATQQPGKWSNFWRRPNNCLGITRDERI